MSQNNGNLVPDDNDGGGVAVFVLLLVGMGLFIAGCVWICGVLYKAAEAVWTFIGTHPIIMILVIVAITITAIVTWNEAHKPKRVLGAFDPAIVLTEWVQNQFPIAAANAAWWLVFYGGWFVAAMTGIGFTLLSGAVSAVDFLFSDMVTAICKLNPEFYKLATSEPWLGYLFLTMVFFSFTAGSLRKTFWLAKCRTTAAQKDPRRVLLLMLVRTIHGWNTHIPVFNDLAASGDHVTEVMNLLEKRTRLIDLMNRMERRLSVAPLGSFPENSDVSELPDFKELNTLVEDLKREPCLEAAWEEVYERSNPTRTPDPKTVEFWEALARFVRA